MARDGKMIKKPRLGQKVWVQRLYTDGNKDQTHIYISKNGRYSYWQQGTIEILREDEVVVRVYGYELTLTKNRIFDRPVRGV